MKELKRNTAAGRDGIRTPDLHKFPTGHVTAIMNHWWGWILPEKSDECRTTLLPKKDEELEKVGNWRPITVGNLLMRLINVTKSGGFSSRLFAKHVRKSLEIIHLKVIVDYIDHI